MTASLRPTCETDPALITAWAESVDASRYMSRFHPWTYVQTGWPVPATTVAWYVIVVGGRDIGTVWLEKVGEDSDTAILGILIGDEQYMGRGIGGKATLEAIRQSRETLGLNRVRLNVRTNNPRAIRCYERCGFRTVSEGSKPGSDGAPIDFYTMELHLGPTPTS